MLLIFLFSAVIKKIDEKVKNNENCSGEVFDLVLGVASDCLTGYSGARMANSFHTKIAKPSDVLISEKVVKGPFFKKTTEMRNF